jgi:hypothetical protein
MPLADSQGYFAPITRPLPLPLGYAVSDFDRMIRFNNGWTPYVLAALGVLTRPETYAGEVASEYAFAIGEGQNLYNAVEDIPLPQTDLYLQFSATSTNGAQFFTQHSAYYTYYRGIALIADDLDGATSLTINVKQHPSGDPAGGAVSVELFYLPVASKAFTVNGEDCLSLFSDSGFVEDGHHAWSWSNLVHATISLSAIYCALFVVTVDGEIQCSPA